MKKIKYLFLVSLCVFSITSFAENSENPYNFLNRVNSILEKINQDILKLAEFFRSFKYINTYPGTATTANIAKDIPAASDSDSDSDIQPETK